MITMIKIAAGLSSSLGRLNPGIWRIKNDDANNIHSPITKNSEMGRVFTSRSGRIPEVWASKSP